MELIKELIEEVAEDFEAHISQAENERILFSGKFGKGKTTFLIEFFNNQDQYCGNEKYQAIFLDPVNYSVASNEDIFRYIKYDILLHLLEQNVNLDSVSFNYTEIASYFIARYPMEVIKGLLRYIPKVGLFLEDQITGLNSLNQKILTFQKETNQQSPDAVIATFLNSIENDSYSLYENDVVTSIIRQLINPENKEKKTVLVIDNLDRIDPEHIFRILNIFSSHSLFSQDHITINKFFFDKVIIVCDINNLRNIYKNKYGADVDFSGYIDKFYSTNIFHFQNYEQIRRVCHKQLRQLIIETNPFEPKSINDLPIDFGIFYLVTTLVFQNKLSLRQLINYCKKRMSIPVEDFDGKNAIETPLIEMQILSEMVGSYHALADIILHLIELESPTNNFLSHLTLLLYFETRRIHNWGESDNWVHWKFNGSTYHIRFQNFNDYAPTRMTFQILSSSSIFIDYHPTSTDYYRLYLKILKEFHSQKLIE